MIEKAFLILIHLFTPWAMWSFHISFESSVSPRNFTFDTFGMWRALMNKRVVPGFIGTGKGYGGRFGG